jgi:hypothetical protein
VTVVLFERVLWYGSVDRSSFRGKSRFEGLAIPVRLEMIKNGKPDGFSQREGERRKEELK